MVLIQKSLLQKHHKHISEQPFTFQNWHKHVNWVNSTIVVIIPLIGFLFAPFTPLRSKTAILAIVYYFYTGMSITAGYHRLWSHRSYQAVWPVRFLFMIGGSGAAEGSIKWWSNGHRTHHRYTDTDKDPYDARRGFWFSHAGWMIFKQNPKLKARCDISDLIEDPIVRFQHRHYMLLLVLSSYVIPTLIAGFGWGDWLGGLVYAGIIRNFVVHQGTFCVNSLAHWIGEQPFDDIRTPRDHVLTAFATFGEGYHNFHHEFPSDYRNALKWYQYDPTKVLIYICSVFGLAYNLQRFPQNAIEQGLVQQNKRSSTDGAQSSTGVFPLKSSQSLILTISRLSLKIEPLLSYLELYMTSLLSLKTIQVVSLLSRLLSEKMLLRSLTVVFTHTLMQHTTCFPQCVLLSFVVAPRLRHGKLLGSNRKGGRA